MAFVKRFSGWRPVQMEEGDGALRLPSGDSVEPVGYRFEVWHQMVDGFPGPFRAEGRVDLPQEATRELTDPEAVLILEDGRFLAVRIAADGELLSHTRPSTSDPEEADG